MSINSNLFLSFEVGNCFNNFNFKGTQNVCKQFSRIKDVYKDYLQTKCCQVAHLIDQHHNKITVKYELLPPWNLAFDPKYQLYMSVVE